ncbi:NHP10 (YDL002C) [Zygosaccharomyces parabailii]|uniref:ZYBA0S03-09054g1_1 n=1 Tax=Zygosaccharomyces bailii (strain CLIB 213 / ATCC 58445 / CBS 680 / BCRC 21525 / NBRC 1098 / NCYC 1416 / NRRL Y-2227) TaxID=1333698 RepID=A0A8J2T6C8_ZYGB2|nr:NHP10 (YDL002C) [Zygosaccharomyces parabailii]CDF89096.1 ZYBA0S03-09054g1_1 [Zygosaccharomyces bailii CLIB 213]CDH16180.1 related to Non-histone protein 10 [Zygosaccharomyces bailii ISA1307]SJM88514.1 related to Non-histone protein 10 [Zygosaccharomyces bailii]
MSDNDLKRKVDELKEGNEVLALAIQRTRLSVKRLKLEYSVLLERLEARVDLDPELRYENPLPTLESFKKELLTKPLKKTKSKRQKAKDRDPNMPKRPTNAYLLFCEMNKEKVRQQGSQDVSRDLTEAWKNLNEQDRKPYYELYSEDRERYQKEMEIYSMKIDHAKDHDEEDEGDENDEVDNVRGGHKHDEEDEEEEVDEEDDEDDDEEVREPESEITQMDEEEDNDEEMADIPTSEI